jgi:hypothetical protein
MKNRNIPNVIVLFMILLVLIVIGCTKQKRMTCDSVSAPRINGDHWSGGLYQTPDGQYLTRINNTAAVFGEPGVIYRVFYSLKNGSYFLAGDITSENCIVIGPYTENVEAYPIIKGEICKNKGERVNYDRFVAVDELRPSCEVSQDKAVEAPNVFVNVPEENQESVEPVILPQQDPSCSDSDGGLDYYVKGSVTGTWEDGSPNNMVYEDKCALGQSGNPDADKDPNALLEAYCFKGTFGYGYDYYSCPNGCNDSVCIN